MLLGHQNCIFFYRKILVNSTASPTVNYHLITTKSISISETFSLFAILQATWGIATHALIVKRVKLTKCSLHDDFLNTRQ